MIPKAYQKNIFFYIPGKDREEIVEEKRVNEQEKWLFSETIPIASEKPEKSKEGGGLLAELKHAFGLDVKKKKKSTNGQNDIGDSDDSDDTDDTDDKNEAKQELENEKNVEDPNQENQKVELQ